MGWTMRHLRRPEGVRRWTIAAGIIGVIATACLLIGIAALPGRQLQASMLMQHTLEMSDAVDALQGNLEIVVDEGRAYLLTGNPARIADVEAAAARLDGDLAALRGLAGGTGFGPTIDHIDGLIRARIAVLRKTIALHDSGDAAALHQRLSGHEARSLTEAIRSDIDAIRLELRRLLPAQQQAADAATRTTAAVLVACGMIAAAAAVGALTLWLSRRREARAWAEMRRTDALLRTILETAPGLIYAKDRQGRFILANNALLDFLGKPFSAIAGRTDREFLDHPAEADAIMANDRRVLAEGKPVVVEETVGSPSGPAIWLSTKTPFRDADGGIVGMVGMSIDITDRKRAEERLQAFNAELAAQVAIRTAELAASESRQRAYFDHSPIGMIVMRARDDGAFVLQDLNPAARAAFGFSRDSAPSLVETRSWREFVARKQARLRACAARREVISYSVASEVEVEGKPRILDVVLAPLLDDSVEARFVLICVHDVTQQRELERQVMEHAARQAEAAEREMAVFRNSPDVLFIVRVEDAPAGPAFVYEAFSPALETLTGLQSHDLVARRPEQCLPPALARSALVHYRRCLQERTTITFAETRSLPVGERDVEGSLTPVQHPVTGRTIRLVGAVRDVTERTRMEAALRHGQKMEAIGRLAAGVAHDFNNILQAVISGLDLVIDEVQAGTPAREFADVALNSAVRGSHLTHHLLAYARRQMLWPQAIDLAAFLSEMRTLLSRTLGPHIAIETQVDGMPRMLVDPGELQTALLNLAINASDAMPKGGTLRIAAGEETAADGAWTTIRVADTGVGMSAATLAQAVEPFFTTKGSAGTGLGLSMVQGFAEQSGGTFRIVSVEGQGTTVELRLPAAASPAPAEAGQAAVARPVSGRILLVDDSTDVLVTVGAFLRKAGFAVVNADSGDAALALLAEQGRFDALVSDFAMPGRNGAELVAECRLLQPDLAAVIITGFAGISERDCKTERMEVLHKPFQRQALLDALLRAMAREAVPGR